MLNFDELLSIFKIKMKHIIIQLTIKVKKMKTIKFYSIIAALAFLTVSCVENSEKYKAAIAQRDSLAVEKQVLDSNYNRTIDILNDVETGFSEISRSQNEMRVNLKGVEGKATSKKELIAAQMSAIKLNIENNKTKIDELRKLAGKSDKANKLLSGTINRLQKEMDEKNAQIQTLQLELDQKNIKISELSTTVSNQNSKMHWKHRNSHWKNKKLGLTN